MLGVRFVQVAGEHALTSNDISLMRAELEKNLQRYSRDLKIIT